MSQIHELLPLVMKAVGGIGKHGRNEAQGYAFMAYGDVASACQTAFVDHGISLGTEVLEVVREQRETKSGGNMSVTLLTVAHTFSAPDGSSVVVTTVGEGADSGDKSANKAMTAALKYALRTLLVIPDAEDGDTESPELGKAQGQSRSAPRPAARPGETGEKATDPQVKKINYVLGSKFGGEWPETVGALFGQQVPPVKDMTKRQASRVIDLMEAAPAVEKAERVSTLRQDVGEEVF